MSTIRFECSPLWIGTLEPETLDCEADTTVGRRVLGYLAAVDCVLRQMDDDEMKADVIAAALEQVSVWHFG